MSAALHRIVALAVAAAWLGAEERFPPPDFSPGYVAPVLTTPAPRAGWLAAADLGLLALALAAAAWAMHRRRSRSAVVAVALASLAWFGFVRQGCICPIGAIQDVAWAAAGGGGLSWVAAGVFLLPLLAALAAGRVFCAGVCPLGAIQDLVLVRPAALPPWLTGLLGLLPYAYLALAVLWAATGAAWVICAYDPFVGIFRLGGPASMIVAGGVLLAAATVIGRPYCRFLCPYGVLLRWLAPLAIWRPRIHPTACTPCRLCEESCPYDALQVPAEPAPVPRRRLASALLALPVLVGGGAWLGHRAGDTLARRHATVALAQHLAAEESGAGGHGDRAAAEAFRAGDGDPAALQARAAAIAARTRTGAAWGGGFLGLVAGLTVVAALRRRPRRDYGADPAACLACARCLSSCPAGRPAAEQP